MKVIDIEAIQRPDGTKDSGTFDLYVTVDGALGQWRFAVQPIALLSYSAFQEAALRSAGAVFVDPFCEGRPVLHADERWRGFCLTITRCIPAARNESGARN